MKLLSLVFITGALVATPSRLICADAPAPSSRESNLALARQLNQAFVQVAEDVSPSVVVITVTQKIMPTIGIDAGDTGDDAQDPLEGLPPGLRKWFRQRQQNAPEKSVGQGSGIIIRPDGFILTNRHVVEDAEKIEVRLKDGRIFTAVVRGVDAPADVAVIKIDAKGLPVAKLADSAKTRVGEFAIAIGAPFALDYTVTFGHVSAKDRSDILSDAENAPTMMDQSFIQTDANINPGNSGGPLVNIDGEVIGINTLIRGLHTGIGFAIPSNLAREISDKLITEGKFTRSYLGIGIRSLREDPDFRQWVPTIRDGVIVMEISPTAPVAKSDLHPTDVITAIDDHPTVTVQQLKDELRSKKVGQKVTLSVFRMAPDGGKLIKVVVPLGEWTDPNEAEVVDSTASNDPGSHSTLGLKVQPLPKDMVDQYGPGVLVSAVERNGLAARVENNIQSGDIITSVNQHPVGTPRQFYDATKSVNAKKGVILNLVREGTTRFELLKEAAN